MRSWIEISWNIYGIFRSYTRQKLWFEYKVRECESSPIEITTALSPSAPIQVSLALGNFYHRQLPFPISPSSSLSDVKDTRLSLFLDPAPFPNFTTKSFPAASIPKIDLNAAIHNKWVASISSEAKGELKPDLSCWWLRQQIASFYLTDVRVSFKDVKISDLR